MLNNKEVEYVWLLVKQCEDRLEEITEKLEKYEKKERDLKNLIQNKDEVNLSLTQDIKYVSKNSWFDEN